MTGTITATELLYATQGGGYATRKNGQFVWHSEIPDFMSGTQVGDPIPDEWDIIPLGPAAQYELEDDSFYLTYPYIEIFDDEEEEEPLIIEEEEDDEDDDESDDTGKYLSAYTAPARTYARRLRDI